MDLNARAELIEKSIGKESAVGNMAKLLMENEVKAECNGDALCVSLATLFV